MLTGTVVPFSAGATRDTHASRSPTCLHRRRNLSLALSADLYLATYPRPYYHRSQPLFHGIASILSRLSRTLRHRDIHLPLNLSLRLPHLVRNSFNPALHVQRRERKIGDIPLDIHERACSDVSQKQRTLETSYRKSCNNRHGSKRREPVKQKGRHWAWLRLIKKFHITEKWQLRHYWICV